MVYTIGMQDIKLHFSSNYFIAQQVKNNLVSRFKKTCLIKKLDENSRFIWNPGGSSYGNTIFEFELAGITLGCYALHWMLFKKQILEPSSAQYNEKFFKLYGVHIICLSLAQKNQLDFHIKGRKIKFDELARKERQLLYTY